MKANEYFKKIQNLSLIKRKVIFWIVIIILTLTLFFLWVKRAQRSIETFPKEEFIEEINLPELEKGLEGLQEDYTK
jgi:hypothetical protein